MEQAQEQGGQQAEGTTEAPDRATAGILADLQRERAARQAAEQDRASLAAWRAEHEPKLTEAETLRSRLGEYEAREAARVQALQAANEAAMAELPAQYRELVPKGLDPETTAAQIARLRNLATTPMGTVARGGAAPGLPPEAQRWFNDRNIPEALRTPEYWARVNPNRKKEA